MLLHDSVRLWPPVWIFAHSEFDDSDVDPNKIRLGKVTAMPQGTIQIEGSYQDHECTGALDCREGVDVNRVIKLLSSAHGKTAFEAGNLEI